MSQERTREINKRKNQNITIIIGAEYFLIIIHATDIILAIVHVIIILIVVVNILIDVRMIFYSAP